MRGFGNAIVRPLAVAFIDSVVDAFVDAALGLHAVVEPQDPVVSVEEATIVVEATDAHVEEEESAA